MNNVNPVTIVPILEEDLNQNCIYLSEQLTKEWNIEINGNITICIGANFVKQIAYEKNIEKSEIHIPKRWFVELYLPLQTFSFSAQYNETTHTLHLAPIIGLLTEINEADPTLPNFRSVHSFCEELEYVTKTLGGFFFVFPLQSFNANHITGYYLYNGNWLKANLPIPDVIYNRIHSRRLEFSPSFHQFRSQLQKRNIPMFNDRFLSKWEVYDVLITESHLQPHTPATSLYSKGNLEDFLLEFPILFLKPIHGSQGRNIIRMEQKDVYYDLQFSYFIEKQSKANAYSINEIHEIIAPYIKNATYIIQQGISFIQYQNRHIDFRVLCHKNNLDEWTVTSVAARLSADKQFVSNVARGGETMRPIKALSLYFDQKTSKQLLMFIKELALEVASIISLNSEGLTGELGIDIGVDTAGKPWVIEANSKPSKNFEEQEIKIRPSAKAIISYCFILALEYAYNKEEGFF